MDTSEVAKRLRTELAELGERRDQLIKALEEIKGEELGLALQLRSLEAIVQRFEPDKIGTDPAFPTMIPETEDQKWWLRLNRQQAVIQALDALGGPAHINEIVGFLTQKGRDDTYQLVSAGLSALRYKGIAEPDEKRGVWKISDANKLPHGALTDETYARLTGGLNLSLPAEDAPG